MCFLARLSDGGDGSSVIFRLTCCSNQSEILQLGCSWAHPVRSTRLLKLACELTQVQQVFAFFRPHVSKPRLQPSSAFFLPSLQGFFCYIYNIAFFSTLQWHAGPAVLVAPGNMFGPSHAFMLQMPHGFFMCWQSQIQ